MECSAVCTSIKVHGRRFGCAELSVEIPAVHGYDNAIQVTLNLSIHRSLELGVEYSSDVCMECL
jgi:hypothetical protein